MVHFESLREATGQEIIMNTKMLEIDREICDRRGKFTSLLVKIQKVQFVRESNTWKFSFVVEDKLFAPRSNWIRCFKLPSKGICPVKLFEERSRCSIYEALDKELGIGPSR